VSFQRLVYWITILAVFAMSARISMDNDSWWHLRAGQWIVEHRTVPKVDEFSYTRLGQSWQYPGWLVEAPMYILYRQLGPGGLNIWTALMISLAFIFLWYALSGGSFLKAFTVILAATVSGVFWAARPYLASFVLTAVFIWILENHRWNPTLRSARRLWWLPVLMVVWVNSHGGFAVGFIVWGIYWIGEIASSLVKGSLLSKLKLWFKNPLAALQAPELRLTWLGILMVLAVCINPYGPVMLAYPLKTVSIEALQDYIQEWQSPDFHLISVQPLIWLLLLTFAAVGASRRRLAFTDFLLVSIFTYMSLLAGRNIALFALAVPPVLTRHAAPIFESISRWFAVRFSTGYTIRGKQPFLNVMILGLVLLVTLVKAATIFPRQVNEQAFKDKLPIDAVQYLKTNQKPGRIFNSYNWGGYLIWSLPEYPVFIDGRTDLYDDELIFEWLSIMRAEQGWKEALDRYQVGTILIESKMPLARILAENQGWRLVYQDDLAVVYVR
jgi:hypothetical protein